MSVSPDATTEAVLGLTFDCVDAPALAAFWALALGYVEAPPPEGWATWDAFLTDQQVPQEEWDEGAEIQPTSGTGPTISFLKVPEPKVAKNRVHLDVKVSGGRHIEPSLRTARIRVKAAELIAAGATVQREDHVNGSLDHLVMADPEGNEFCIA